MRAVVTSVSWGLVVALPLLLLFGLERFPVRVLAAVFMAVAALRMLLLPRSGLPLPVLLPALLLVLALIVFWSGNADWFRFYPVAVNALLLTLFALSLRHGPSLIERLARLREPDLPPPAVDYTRRVTQVWCLFFLLNGSIALYTALCSSLSVWAWYNGGIAYLLMGALFAIEFIVRRRVMRAHRG